MQTAPRATRSAPLLEDNKGRRSVLLMGPAGEQTGNGERHSLVHPGYTVRASKWSCVRGRPSLAHMHRTGTDWAGGRHGDDGL